MEGFGLAEEAMEHWVSFQLERVFQGVFADVVLPEVHAYGRVEFEAENVVES